MSALLAGNRGDEPLAAFGPAAIYNLPTVQSGHPLAEAVVAQPLDSRWLVRSFHS